MFRPSNLATGWGIPNQKKKYGSWCLKPGDVLFSTLITHGMYPLTVIGVLHLSRENQSYPKVVPRTDFGRQKWSYLAKTGPSRTKFGKQNWSGGPLLVAKKGPILPKLVSKFGKQNWFGGPLLATESSPPNQFGLIQMVLHARRLSRYMQAIYMKHKQKEHSF